jgi:hypothetical protein
MRKKLLFGSDCGRGSTLPSNRSTYHCSFCTSRSVARHPLAIASPVVNDTTPSPAATLAMAY